MSEGMGLVKSAQHQKYWVISCHQRKNLSDTP